MATYETNTGPIDVFDDAYWEPITQSGTDLPPPKKRVQNEVLSDKHAAMRVAAIMNNLNAEIDKFIPLAAGVDFVSFINNPESRGLFIVFQRERLVKVGNTNIGAANAVAEDWILNSDGVEHLVSRPQVHGYRNSASGLYMAHRYEMQEGTGIILPTAFHENALFGIKQATVTIRAKKGFGFWGGFGLNSVPDGPPVQEIKHSFVPLFLPAHRLAKIGEPTLNGRVIKSAKHGESCIQTYERLIAAEFLR